MSAPEIRSRSFTPRWLAVEDVKDWLRINSQDTADDATVRLVTAAAEPYVERCRPEFVTAEGYTPDAETYMGAVMYAAREVRRRNSPAGVEVFGEAAAFVTRYDSDIDRALQTGAFARPVIA